MPINARAKLDATCATMYIVAKAKFYCADENPFEDTPFLEMQLTPH